MINIIRSMYEGVKSRVKHCNQLGNSFECQLGVRQGECLSPFLFSMFLNDIEDTYIKSGIGGIDVDMFKVFLILYADDIVLFADTKIELQNSLDLLYNYCNRWKLIVNHVKTKVMVFRKGGRLSGDLGFTYGGRNIEITNRFAYLGIVFCVTGSFTEAQHTLSGQAIKAIFKMNRYLYKFTYIPVKHRLDLFNKLIMPILNYGSEVWGFHPGKALDRVYMQFCKRLLGVKKGTQNDFVYGELGILPLKNIRFMTIIKYWTKILLADDRKYFKKIYRMLYQDSLDYPNRKNWCNMLKELLCTLGFHDAWIFQTVGDAKIFLSEVKVRIKDQFLQNWHSRLNESSRAVFYRHIADFRFQPYLELLCITKFRNCMSRLRLSSHRLSIETGRWNKPVSIPRDERKCLNCNTLEDEFHFTLECNLYKDLRKQFIPQNIWKYPSMLKFINLITSENQIIVKNLSSYIEKAFQLRSNLLYVE